MRLILLCSVIWFSGAAVLQAASAETEIGRALRQTNTLLLLNESRVGVVTNGQHILLIECVEVVDTTKGKKTRGVRVATGETSGLIDAAVINQLAIACHQIASLKPGVTTKNLATATFRTEELTVTWAPKAEMYGTTAVLVRDTSLVVLNQEALLRFSALLKEAEQRIRMMP